MRRVVGGRHTEAILVASAAVRPGEWTTYGEVSVAVFGHRSGARAVARVAARDDRFSNAHRVIAQGGRIPAGWGGGGAAIERCQRRLETEGVGNCYTPPARAPTRILGDVVDPSARRKPPRVVRVRLFLVNLVERLFALLARQM